MTPEQSDTPVQPECQTCGGRGEIGGWFGQTAESGGYVTEPCPDCTPPEQPTPAVPVADYEQKPARSVEDAEHLK